LHVKNPSSARPSVRVLVEEALVHGDADARDGDAGLGVAELGVIGEVADDGDDVVVGHGILLVRARTTAGSAGLRRT
jgi:hypothetical protein